MKAILALLVVVLLVACGSQAAPQPAPAPAPEPTPPVEAQPTPAPAPPAEPTPAAPAENTPIASGESDAKSIEYDKNDLITNVACDYEKGTVSFTLKNTAGKDLIIYHGEVPTPMNSLKISINGMQFNSPKIDVKADCGDSVLKADETRTCTGEGIEYRKPENYAETSYNQKGKNRLLAQYTGKSDVTYFECFSN